MRVLLVPSPPFEEIGGVSTHVYMLQNGLKKLGHQVWIVPARPIRLYRAPFVSLPGIILGKFSRYVALRWNYISTNFYYLVHSLSRSCFKADVINIQNVQHVAIARKLKEFTGGRIILTVHGFLTYEAEQAGLCCPGDRIWNWLFSMEKNGYASVDHIVAVSEKTAEYVSKFSHAPISIIYNGINTKLFRPLENNLNNKDLQNNAIRLRLLFAGVLEPHKGLRDAIEVLYRLRNRGLNVSLAVAGKGYEQRNAKQLAEKMGIGSHIIWHGAIPKSRMPEFYAGGDILLIPSKPRGSGGAEESFPYTALEAMACGIPVVAYRTGGLAEQIQDGITGYLVPQGDIAAMVEVVNKLACNRIRKEMGKNARRHVAENFSMLSMARKFIGVYQSSHLKG